MNRQRNTQRQKTRSTSNGHPTAQRSPQKKDNTITAAFQGGGFSPFPPGSNYLFSSLPLSLSLGLWPCCRKMVFDELAGVVAEPARAPTRSFDEKMSPLIRSYANEQIAVGDGSSCLPYPLDRGILLSGCFKTRTSR